MKAAGDTTLADVATFRSGGTPEKRRVDFYGGSIPWITGADIGDGEVASARSFISDAAVKQSAATVVRKGAVLLVTRTTVGKVAIAPWDLSFSQDITAVLPDESRLDASYLVRFLESQRRYFEARARGATIKGLTRDSVAGIAIPLPPLAEQRRIAQALNEADAIREKRRVAIERLDALAEAIFKEMFRDLAVTAGTVPLPEAFWFQEGPGVRNWQFRDTGVKLLNVANIVTNGTLDLSKTDRHLDWDEVQSRYKHFLADEGDLVVASSGISFAEDGMLRTRGAFVEARHLPLCMNTSTIRFKAIKGRSNLAYLKQWLNTVEFRSQISRRVTGSAQQNFGPSHLKALRITLPSIQDQDLFAAHMARVERARAGQLSHITHLEALFASIQARGFRGGL